jgi:hypothetical protein
LEIEGLPEGSDFEPKTIPAKAKTAELRFSIPPKTPLSSHFLKIKGTLGAGPAALVRTAVVPGAPFAVQKAREEALLLAVVPRVPFQFFGGLGAAWTGGILPAMSGPCPRPVAPTGAAYTR